MKHEHFDRRARVWVVTLGADGRLEAELDQDLLARLGKARSEDEVTGVLTDQVARTPSW